LINNREIDSHHLNLFASDQGGKAVNLEELNAIEKKKIEERRQGDLIIFLVLLGVCIGWLALTFQIPGRGQYKWPGMLPMVLLFALIVMDVVMLVSLYLPNRENRNIKSLYCRISLTLKNPRGTFYRGVATILILYAYALLLIYLPKTLMPPGYSYVIATLLFIGGMLTLFRASKRWVILLVAVLTTSLLSFIFGYLYRTPLP
jgi:hypothetical protein